MKKLPALFLTLLVASHFGTTAVFAQKKIKPTEVIVIEFLVPDRESFDKWEIPINKNSREKLSGGGGNVSECLDYSDTECAKIPYSSYDFYGKAFALDKNKTKVSFKIKINDECKTRWFFTVYRNRQNKIQLGCGVSLVAYYGFESKEAN